MSISENYNCGNDFVESLAFSASRFDLLFFCLFSTIVCTVLLGNAIFFDSDILMKSLRVAAVCMAFIFIFYCLSRIFNSIAWAMGALLGLIMGIVYFNSFLANALFYFLAGTACLYTFKSIEINKKNLCSGLLAGVVGAATILSTQAAMTSFNMLKRLMAGDVHIDTLFHSSVAAMIKNYGVSSTGLHGLVEVKYHTLSHWIMAGVSSLSGVGVFEVYGIAQQIFFIPMLFFSIVLLCHVFNRDNNLNTVLLWGLVCFLLTALPYCLLNHFGLVGTFFNSESHTLSLSIMLIGSGYLYKRSLSYADIVLVAFLGMLMTEAKGSVGLIYMGLWWIRSLFFMKQNKANIIFATVLVSISVVLTVYTSAVTSASLQKFGPFFFVGLTSFWGEYINMATHLYVQMRVVNVNYLIHAMFSVLVFLVMHFSISWAAVGQSVFRKGLKFLWRSPVALYSLGSIGAGMLVASFLKNWIVYYFTSIAFFVSLPTFLVLCYMGLMKYRVVRITAEKNSLAVLVPVFALVMTINYSQVLDMFKYQTEFKKDSMTFVETLVNIQMDSAIDQCLTPSETFAEQNPINKLTAKPFVYPAISERPWINVIRNDERSVEFKWYGYEQYGLNTQLQVITIEPVLAINDKRTLQISAPVENLLKDVK